MALKVGIVELEEYNPNWKEMYYKEEEILKELLKDNIVDIMHVGSTSIEGLSAKPIIDIMVIVKNLKNVEKFKHLFTKKLGYDFRDDKGESGEYLVRKGDEDARTHFIHIVEENSERYKNFVYFKNYLEHHPDKIIKYKKLKEEFLFIEDVSEVNKKEAQKPVVEERKYEPRREIFSSVFAEPQRSIEPNNEAFLNNLKEFRNNL